MRGFTRLIKLDNALRIVLSRVRMVCSETVRFDRALGRVLAEDVASKVDVPPFDRSAVDGYAVRAVDTFGASQRRPARLRVVGSIKIGSPTKLRVQKGDAAKIMTGAPMPRGADAVVMVEHTRVKGRQLEVFKPLTRGKNDSMRGEDVRKGKVVLKRGHQLRPPDIGMLASTGHLQVRVARKPRVAILATGGELRKPGERLKGAQITDVNSYSLAAAVARCGGLPGRLGIVPDRLKSIRQALLRARSYDATIISAGSSVGERDLVPNAIGEVGKILFHGVAIRPGAPTAFGIVEGKPVFALAGFPVSSLVAFDLLVRPALRAMQGLPPNRGYPRVRAKLARKVSSAPGRARVLRVGLREERGGLLAEPIQISGSSMLSTITSADGFVIVPEDAGNLRAGTVVEVELY